MPVIDSLSLTVPNDRRFFAVPRLLVGGIALRLNLHYEQLDDLQLAVEEVLLRGSILGDEVTLEASIGDGAVVLAIGPLRREALSDRLPDPAGGIGLGRLLGTLVDELEVEDRDSAQWLRLEKRVSTGAVRET